MKAEDVFVIEFLIFKRDIPNDSLAAIFAIGYPVAFDASADERDNLGLTSTTTYSNQHINL